MIEEHAVILALEPQEDNQNTVATLEVVRKTACSICGQTRGCGNQVWGKVFAHKAADFKAKNVIGAKVGDAVVVGIDEHAFMRSAVFLYMIPLVSMLVATVLIGQVSDSNGLAIIAAIAGLVAGFVWVKGHVTGHRYFQYHQPVILRLDQS